MNADGFRTIRHEIRKEIRRQVKQAAASPTNYSPNAGLRRLVSTVVLDAFALLAAFFREPGAELVTSRGNGGVLSAVCYSETIVKLIDRGLALADAQRMIGRLSLHVAAFDSELASLAASFHQQTRTLSLSFADHACLALGVKTGFPVLTADRRWADVPGDVTVELIR